jgi:hypothetical protein
VKSRHTMRRGGFAALAVLASGSMSAAADDRRWRVFEETDKALLSASHTDEPTDDLGSPFFRCQRKSGTVVVEGTATQALRDALADLIRSNGYPQVDLLPSGSASSALLNVSYSEMGSNWQYSFELEVAGKAFDEFKRTGRFTFKVGSTVVREEFKVGLENVDKFQAICKR